MAGPGVGLTDVFGNEEDIPSLKEFVPDLPKPPSEFKQGVKRGGYGLASDAARAAQAVSTTVGVESGARFFDKLANEAAAAGEEFRPRVASPFDVSSPRDAWDYTSGLFGEQAVRLPITALSAYLGGRTGARLNKADQVLGTMLGATAGAAVPSYVENFGNILNEQKEAGVPQDIGVAAKYALPIAALDAVGPGAFFGMLAEPGKKATKGAVRDMFNKILVGSGLGAAEEAPTEGLQEYLAVQARGAVDPNYDTNSEEARRRVLSGAIAGGIVGGGIGGAGGGARSILDSAGAPSDTAATAPQAAEETRAAIQSPTPAPTAEPEESDEVIQYRQIMGVPEIDAEPLPLIDTPGGPVREQDDFTSRLAEADAEFASKPEALVAQALRSRIPEIQAELTLLDRESKQTGKNKRPAAEIAADREQLQVQLETAERRAKQLETLAETPQYQPKSSLPVGTLLAVDQDANKRTEAARQAFVEESAKLQKQTGGLVSGEQVKALKASEKAAAEAAAPPVIAPRDRARSRQVFGGRDNTEELVRAKQSDVVAQNVKVLVDNEMIRPTVAKSIGTIINKAVDQARKETDPAKRDEIVAAAFQKAVKGKKIPKVDRDVLEEALLQEINATYPQPQEEVVKPLRSIKPEFLAGIPEDAVQDGLFTDEADPTTAVSPTITFSHWGNVPGGVTDPTKIGTGVRGADWDLAAEAGIQYTSAVVDGTKFVEQAVTQQPRYVGTLRSDKVRVARGDDPLLLEARAENQASGTFNDSLDWMLYAKKVRDAGYDAMMYAQGQLRIFTPQPVSPAFNLPSAKRLAEKIFSHHYKNGGSTFNLVTGQEMGGTANYSVSPYKKREQKIDKPSSLELRQFMEKNEDLLSKPNHFMGTWLNEEDGLSYLDVAVLTPSFKKAQALARKHKQIAFFNLRTFKEVPTDSPEPEQFTLFRNTSEFNNQDAVYHSEGQRALEELDRILGTPEGLSIKLVIGEGDAPAGIYQQGKLKDVITLATNAQDITSVAAHEGFHYLEERVLKASDKAVLARSFAPDSRMFKRLEAAAIAYDQTNGTNITDEIRAIPAEARAYGYEFWKRGELQADGVLQRVFEYIRDLLDRVANMLSGHGFNNAKDIFASIDRGAYATRQSQALYVDDTDPGNAWINDIEPDAIVGLQKAGAKTKKNMITSEAKGRPPQVTSPGALGALRRQLRTMALEGADGRFWHEDSGRAILDFYNGDQLKAEMLAKLIAIMSPRTNVGGDLLFALQAIEQHNNGQEIRAGVYPKEMSRKAAEVLTLNESERLVTGIKRNTFYRNLMKVVDPDLHNSETQGATIDMWMAHFFGYNKNLAGAVTKGQYRWAEAEVGKLARELGWGIEEVQAAVWVSVKARWNTVRGDMKKLAEKKGWMTDSIDRKTGKVTRKVAKKHVAEFMSKWRQKALAVEKAGDKEWSDAMFNYGDAIRTVLGAELAGSQDIKLPNIDDGGLAEMENDDVNITDLEEDQDVGDVALKYYSKAALADLITQAKRGENVETQMYSVIADMVDKAKVPDKTVKEVFGGNAKRYTNNVAHSWKTFVDQYVSSGLHLSRKSAGYKNMFNVLTKYTQRKNRLIADTVDIQLSRWRSANGTQHKNASTALLKRTVNAWKLDSPEMNAELQKLSAEERAMFHQATDMMKNRLLAEFEADKVSYRTLLGEGSPQYTQWLVDRKTHVDQLIEDGYFPERRFGDHGVHTYIEVDGKKITLSYELESTRGAAEQRAQDMAEVLGGFPEIKTEYAYKYKAEFDGSTSFQQFLDIARRENVSLTQAEKERLAKAMVASDSVRRNRIFRRKNVPGYSEDGMRILAEFAVTMSNKISYAEYGSALQDALKGRKVDVRIDDNGNPQIQIDENTNVWEEDGELAGFYRNLADETADFVLSPRPGNKVSSFLRGAATFNFLGGSLAAGGVQLTSLAMNTSPYLSQHTSYTDAVGKTLSALKTVAGNSSVVTSIPRLNDRINNPIPAIDSVPGLRAAMIKAAEDGTTLDTEIYQIMGLTRGKMLAQKPAVQKAMNVWMAPFRVTEQWNRASTFIAAYKVGMQNNLTGDALYDFAQKTVYDTQFRYDEANRPAIARGPWGAALFTFKTYPIFMFELMRHLFKQKDKKAAITMVLSLVAMSGVQGLPFAEDIGDLIDTLAQRFLGADFNTKRAMRNKVKEMSELMVGVDLSGWLMHGAANQLTGMEFASRVGLGNIVPGTRMGAADADYKSTMGEILGPTGAVAQGWLSGLDFLSRGEMNKAAKVALPLAGRNLVKGAEQFQSGFATDIGGRNIVPVGTIAAAWQTLGFSSSALSSAYETDRMDRARLAFYTQAKKSITNDIIKAVRRGDAASVQEAVDQIQAWNNRHMDMPIVINGATLRRSIALAGMPLNQRNLLLLPKALRSSSQAAQANAVYGNQE